MNRQTSPNGEPECVYLVGGEANSLSEKWVKNLREQVFTDGGEDFNLDRFDGKQVSDVDVIAQAARTLPMLSPKRLVLVNNAEVILAFSKDRAKPLIDYVVNPDPSTVLVLYTTGKIPKASALAKALHKHAQIVEFAALREREVLPWLQSETKSMSIRMDRDAALLLIDCLSTDLRALTDALTRLSLFVGDDGIITAASVSELVVPSRTKTIWEFLDAVGHRRPGQALQSVGQILDQGDAPLQVLAMVARLFRQLTTGHAVLQNGGSASAAAKEAGIPRFKEASFIQQCRQYTRADLAHARSVLYDLDKKLKSSKLDGRLWLEHGILEIAAPRP